VGRLVDAGVATAIKYAIVRDNPVEDDYLEALLRRVSRDRILSGIGERPAITHLQTFGLRSMTTGSGCIAPHTCAAFFSACRSGDWRLAAALREVFMPLEDLRDAWGPARVLHHAAELCGIAATGPIPPFASPLGAAQMAQLAPVATALLETRA
jgi:dihydrodipicolinate synthase/N-acetylneuraminate lyase